jgi:two-component system OmpR family sensor kinase
VLERLGFRTRLALGHQVAIVVVLAVAALGTYWTLSRAVHGQLDAALLAVANTELSLLTDARRSGDASAPVRTHEVPPGPAAPFYERLDRLVQIIDADGGVLARSANLGGARLPVSAAVLSRLPVGEPIFETLQNFGGEPTRLLTLPLPLQDARPGAPRAIQVAGSLDDVNQVLRSVGTHFVAMGLALMLVVGATGLLLTRRVFGAIDDVVHQARSIGDPALSRRLPHPGTHDEIARLVETLNGMLDRLEHAFEAQRRFTAAASHELRSPLSRLRTELELSLRRPREPADYVQTLRSCMEEVERLTLFVEELLLLARFDAGQERGRHETVVLDELANEAVRRVQPAAQERGVAVSVESTCAVAARIARGAAMLVLGNLLDNAIKFAKPPGRVVVRLAAEGGRAVIRVEDTGPGIGPTELPYVFDRFYRTPAVRAGTASGVGLGLSICQAVVRAHGGEIEVANRSTGGCCFTVTLPLAEVVAGTAA